MRLLDDERGQSVQVGAAILLGFVVIAITLYQVEVVSSQNAEVEFNHDQEIRDQLTELRNSINNAGTQGESDSVSVKLGEQYPPRTIFVNPPPIQGALQSQQAGNISFRNVQVQGSYGGSGNATELVSGNHTTNRLVYVPRYFELDDAGVTSIEHSLAFKAFENNATDPLTRQRVVRGDSLTLTVLQGNLSEQGTQSISLDPKTVSGPTDPITIEPEESSGPIEIHLPTATPNVWNETIGTEFGDNEARIAGYDGTRVYLELNRSEYQLQMALVEVGEGVNETDRYDVSNPDTGGGSGTDTFDIGTIDTNSPIKQGETLKVEADIVNTGSAEGTQLVDLYFDGTKVDSKSVTLEAGQSSNVRLTYAETESESTGDHRITVETDDQSENRSIEIEDPPSGSYFDVGAIDSNAPITEGDTLEVEATVKNIGDTSDTQEIGLEFDGADVDTSDLALDPGEEDTVTLTYSSSNGDADSAVPIRVYTDDTDHRDEVSIQSAEANYDVAITSTPEEVGAGEDIAVDVRIRNDGEGVGTQDIELHRSGRSNPVDIESSVSLDPGEETTFTLSAPTNGDDAGTNVDISAESEDDSDTRTVSVLEAPSFSVVSLSSNSPVVEGDSLQVTAEIENAEGSGTGTQTVQLDLRDQGGTIVGQDSVELTLAGGESDTVTLTYDSMIGDGSPSDYEADVSTENDDDRNAVTIQPLLRFTPGSEGLSGNTGMSFTIEKMVTDQISITDFRLDGNFAAAAEDRPTQVNNGGGDELDVSVSGGNWGNDGWADAGGGNDAFRLGTQYSFDQGGWPQFGDGSGATGTFEIREFENDQGTVELSGVQQGTESNHNFAVTVYYQHAGQERSNTYYFILQDPAT